jgi:hypothetical protein
MNITAMCQRPSLSGPDVPTPNKPLNPSIWLSFQAATVGLGTIFIAHSMMVLNVKHVEIRASSTGLMIKTVKHL